MVTVGDPGFSWLFVGSMSPFRDGFESLRLVWAHGQRQLLWLLEVVDLGRQIVPPQRDAEWELHPGHDPVAIADAETGFDQVQLKAANVGGGVERALQERRKPPAAVDVAALGMALELRALMSSIMR